MKSQTYARFLVPTADGFCSTLTHPVSTKTVGELSDVPHDALAVRIYTLVISEWYCPLVGKLLGHVEVKDATTVHWLLATIAPRVCALRTKEMPKLWLPFDHDQVVTIGNYRARIHAGDKLPAVA